MRRSFYIAAPLIVLLVVVSLHHREVESWPIVEGGTRSSAEGRGVGSSEGVTADSLGAGATPTPGTEAWPTGWLTFAQASWELCKEQGTARGVVAITALLRKQRADPMESESVRERADNLLALVGPLESDLDVQLCTWLMSD